MKKLVAIILFLVMVVSATSAFAYGTKGYSFNTSSTSVLQAGFSGTVVNTGDQWKLSITSGTISSTHRAVVRVHHGDDAASASWVYSSNSSTPHSYGNAYLGGGYTVQPRGRLDNRDSGTLKISGTFYY